MDALNQTVNLLKTAGADPESTVEKNYQVIANEIRRRMQANVENFVLLQYEHETEIDKETGFVPEGEYKPSEYKDIEHAYIWIQNMDVTPLYPEPDEREFHTE